MAKSGTITATAGASEPLKEGVAQSDPRVSTLGSVVSDALSLHPAKAMIFVDTKARKVAVCDPTAGVIAKMNALRPSLAQDDLNPTDLTKKSTPWTVGDLDGGPLLAALQAMVAAKAPSFAIASLISAIEDEATASGKDVVIVIDQVNAQVNVFQGTPAQVAAENIVADLLLTPAEVFAVFEQAVEASSGPKDPFE